MMFSVGPDKYIGLYPGGGSGLTTIPGNYPSEPQNMLNSVRNFYDATNGTVSRGNVYYFSGGLDQKGMLWAF